MERARLCYRSERGLAQDPALTPINPTSSLCSRVKCISTPPGNRILKFLGPDREQRELFRLIKLKEQNSLTNHSHEDEDRNFLDRVSHFLKTRDGFQIC